MMTTRRSSIQATHAAINEAGPLSPSPWDTMLQRRRSSLGLSSLLGFNSAGHDGFANENGGRLSWTLTANDQQSMFGAIAELAGIAEDLSATANSSGAPAHLSSSSSPGKLDGGADGAVPDMEMSNAAAEGDAAAANLGFVDTIRRASITLNALLSGASDPMLKPTISKQQQQASSSFSSSSLASQAASAAVIAAINATAASTATSSSSSSSSSSSASIPAAPQLSIEIEPWAIDAAAASLHANRKRSRDATEESDYDDDGYTGSASEAGSPLPFNMDDIITTPLAKKQHTSSSKTGQKRPRRVPPNSRAVLEAMPKPPPRGLKNLVKEEMYASMEPEAARLEKNRQSAKECRLRKKEYVFNLEKKVAEFENREVGRAAELADVRAQLAKLQREYSGALAKTGRN